MFTYLQKKIICLLQKQKCCIDLMGSKYVTNSLKLRLKKHYMWLTLAGCFSIFKHH